MNTLEAKKVFLQQALDDLTEIVNNADPRYIPLLSIGKLANAIRDVGFTHFNSLAVKRIEEKEAKEKACPEE